MAINKEHKEFSDIREKFHEVIFEADTPAGKWFDIILLIAIGLSVVAVLLESVPSLSEKYETLFLTVEWVLTIFFTIEYVLRLYCVHSPKRYATSFFGIIDLLAILPAYIGVFLSGAGHHLAVIRALRLLRVFRIFKMASFLRQGKVLQLALRQSWPKITVFLFFVMILVVIIGSIMYLIEGGQEFNDFDSIPRSIYWAIVTLTTVGYGDITPHTNFGQFLAAMVMILGYAIIAVPTGIVTGEIIKSGKDDDAKISTQCCSNCQKEGHDVDAEYCKFCGFDLHILKHRQEQNGH